MIRDIERKAQIRNTTMTVKMTELLALVKRMKAPQKNSSDEVYAIHAAEVACTAKGKARNPHEFGAKLSITVTVKDSWMGGKNFQRQTGK